jgi:hypothetical protein
MICCKSVGKIRKKLRAKAPEVLGAAVISQIVLLEVSVVWVKSYVTCWWNWLSELKKNLFRLLKRVERALKWEKGKTRTEQERQRIGDKRERE